jgi:hypothetical protein
METQPPSPLAPHLSLCLLLVRLKRLPWPDGAAAAVSLRYVLGAREDAPGGDLPHDGPRLDSGWRVSSLYQPTVNSDLIIQLPN